MGRWVLAGVVAMLGVAAVAGQRSAGGRFEGVELTAVPVRGHVFMVQRPGGASNVGVFAGPEGVLLVDSLFAPLSDRLVAAVKTVSDAEIRFLVNTHVHPDHIGGNAPLAGLGVLIVAHDNVRVRALERLRFPRGGGRFAPRPTEAARPVVTYDRAMLDRFMRLTGEAKRAGLDLGQLHAASSYEVQYLPDNHLDMVRPGNLLFGNFRREPWLEQEPDLRTVFRLRARIVRVERLRTGDTGSFGRSYVATKPTWTALIPTGHVDGYPAGAVKTCEVLVGDRLYPVIATVSSTHTLIEIGDERTVDVGDVATLIGPDDPAIAPHAVAERAGIGFYTLITKMNALLPKVVV